MLSAGIQLAQPQPQLQRRRHRRSTPCFASATSTPVKPDWAGDSLMSKFVNGLIGTPILYNGIMKPMARQVLINTAEKNGVRWRNAVSEWEQSKGEVDAEFARLTNPAVTYPEYYLMPFHAYDEGNLNWLAAFEAEPATYAMALRVWPQEVKAGTVDSLEAQRRLRKGYTDALAGFISKHGLAEPKTILDIGCSIGISTRALSAAFPAAKVTGLDLSAYMLAVASLMDKKGKGMFAEGAERRSWVHGKAEDTKLADNSLDVYSAAFTIHECPQYATRDIIREAFRVLKPGGVFIMCDNDPKSPVIQKLPGPIFTLMKSTEPHSDDYYTMDIEGALSDAGFADPTSGLIDPRHRAICARKP